MEIDIRMFADLLSSVALLNRMKVEIENKIEVK